MFLGSILSSLLLVSQPSPAGGEGATAPDSIYTMDTCPVSGKKLGSAGEPVIYSYKGRELRFCSKDCAPKFEKDPDSYIKKLDEKVVQQQLAIYPLQTCVVSGEKFGGEMGEPVNYLHNNRLIRFCCKDCIKKFEKEPANYLSKLDQAVIVAQKANYPLKTCVVSSEKLGEMGEPVDFVVNNRLVRFCCKDCVKDFRKDPAKFLTKLGVLGKNTPDKKTESAVYACPMHPEVTASTASKCPKCGMDLVKSDEKKKPHEHGGHGG